MHKFSFANLNYFVNFQGFAFSFQRGLAERLEGHRKARRSLGLGQGRLAQDYVGAEILGFRLEPGGNVHRISYERVF